MIHSKFSRFRMGVSVLALSAATLGVTTALPAYAQEAGDTSEVTEVIITGQRAQIRSAQKIKKDADVVVDSITAVDIGALPDRSVAEALQRVAGLQIQRASDARDPIRMTAEGGGVVIRGLAWVRSETNGRDIFSAKNGRSLSWEDVSADLLAGIDVYKNPSADMIEGGIGGTVNLRTRLPFDSRGRVVAFTVDSTYGDLQEKRNTSGSVVYSDRWETNIGEVGLLLNYSLGNVGNQTHVIGVDRYVDSGTHLHPNTLGWRTIDWNQKREAFAGALQWRPNEALEFTLQVFNSRATPKNTEYNAGFYNDSGEITAPSPESQATYRYNGKNEFIGGTIYGASITANTRYGHDQKETTDISLGARWYVNDQLTVTADVQRVKSTADILSNMAVTQYCSVPINETGGCPVEGRAIAEIDLTHELPHLTLQTPNQTDQQSAYWWAAAMDHLEDNRAEQTSARLDVQYDFADAGWLRSVKAGIRTTDRDYVTRQSNWNWGALSHQYWGALDTDWSVWPPVLLSHPVYLDETGGHGAVPPNPNLPNLSELIGFDGFMHGDVPVPGNIWFPSAALVNQGTQYTKAQLLAVQNASWGWSPATLDNQGAAGLNEQSEKTSAIYGFLKFGSDLQGFGQSFDGNIGVRYVKTDVDVGASQIQHTALSNIVPCVDTPETAGNCAAYANIIQFGAAAIPVTGGSSYDNVLPSLNLRFKYNDQLQFRFAASKAMVRPEMAWLSPYTNLSSAFTTVLDEDSGTYYVSDYTLTGSAGASDLKPVEANQFDLTAEWYFAATGSLTLALFKKELSNYIYVDTSPETYTNNGTSATFNVNRYVNGSEEGKVDGFEIAYSQFYDFLPGFWSGFGIQANYTKINSSGGRNPVTSILSNDQVIGANLNVLPLEGMSPESYNFALMYEKYGLSARMAYNWRSDYLLTTSAANVNRPMWAEAYGQWDGSIFYDLTPHYKIGLQVTNVGRDINYIRVSSDLTRPLETQYYSATKSDRRVSLILRGNF